MSESDAAYYQAHKDDPDEWEDQPAPRQHSRSRRLAAMVSVRFSPVELDRLRQAAERRGESLSGFVRGAALRATHHPMTTASVTGTRTAVNWLQGPAGQPTTPLPAVIGLPRGPGETRAVH